MAKTFKRTSTGASKAVRLNTNAQLEQLSNRVRINGQTIDKNASRCDDSKTNRNTTLSIMKALKKLSDNGLASFAPESPDSGFDLTGQATNLLNAMNVSVDTSFTKNLNLKDEQTDREVVANPNLQDQKIKSAKKELTKATDKFPCSDDSFYELDSAPDQFVQAKNDKILTEKQPAGAITSIGADLAGINLDSSNTVTTQFK